MSEDNEGGVQRADASEVQRTVRPLNGAVWIYPMHNFHCLKAEDGEILAEIFGSGVSDLWTYKGKTYHELENAKRAAIRGLEAPNVRP